MRRHNHLFVFISLDPAKPLLTKLQNHKQYIHKAYQMTDSITEELKKYKNGIG